MITQQTLTIPTQGRGTINITDKIAQIIAKSLIQKGICQIFLQHTSASLTLCENTDLSVRNDLEAFMARFIKDGDAIFSHNAEGPDDMPAHLRTIFTQNSLTIPLQHGHLCLGTWQGIFLWEHRLAPHQRQMMVTVIGEL